jgi:hypothetical protein
LNEPGGAVSITDDFISLSHGSSRLSDRERKIGWRESCGGAVAHAAHSGIRGPLREATEPASRLLANMMAEAAMVSAPGGLQAVLEFVKRGTRHLFVADGRKIPDSRPAGPRVWRRSAAKSGSSE